METKPSNRKLNATDCVRVFPASEAFAKKLRMTFDIVAWHCVSYACTKYKLKILRFLETWCQTHFTWWHFSSLAQKTLACVCVCIRLLLVSPKVICCITPHWNALTSPQDHTAHTPNWQFQYAICWSSPNDTKMMWKFRYIPRGMYAPKIKLQTFIVI